VAGKVYYDDEVNYWLYGVCASVIGMPESVGESFIPIWRVFTAYGSGISGRIDWFKAGYSGDFSYAAGAAIPGVTPNNMIYPSTLEFYVGDAAAGTHYIQTSL
jgi:hypothetical protein